jgi:serine/threonine-protein kinase
MAEVLLAAAEGPGGFSKKVVIKRIRPEHANDPTFVQMFLDEAKLASLLNHPNVVQVFDFGSEDGTYYLAMEYIEGISLRNLLRVYKDKAETLPVGLACQIIHGVCEGLHYAHELCDSTGVSLNLVHRDVTPENILISTSGIPKIVDFGIAKASSRITQTQAGVLKGKYAYMPVEQIDGQGIDRRVDVYALGVSFFEAVTGQKPFRGESELELLKKILTGEAPNPATLNPAIPSGVAEVIAKAMARDRDVRYPTARALQVALDEVIPAAEHRSSRLDISGAVREALVLRRSQNPLSTPTGPKGVMGFPSIKMPQHDRDDEANVTVNLDTSESRAIQRTDWRKWAIVAGISTLVLAVLIALTSHRGTAPVPVVSAPSTVATPTPPAPPQAPVPPAPVSPPAAVPPVAAPAAAQAIGGDGPAPDPTPVRAAAATRAATPAKARSPEKGGMGSVTVRADPPCHVYLDGEHLGMTPLVRSPVSAGKHALQLKNEAAGARRSLTVDVASGKELTQVVRFPVGYLQVKGPAGTRVYVNGEPVGNLPLSELPMVEGPQQVRVVNGQLGRDERRTVTVKDGEEQTLKLPW